MSKIFWFFFAFVGPITFIQFGYRGLEPDFIYSMDPIHSHDDVNYQWLVLRISNILHNNHILLLFLTIFTTIYCLLNSGKLKFPKVIIVIFLFYFLSAISSYYNNVFDIEKYGQYFFFFLPIIFVFFFFKKFHDIKLFLGVILIYLLFNGLVGLYDTFQWIYWNGFNYGWQEYCYFNYNCPYIGEGKIAFRVTGLAYSAISYVMLLAIGLTVSDMKITNYSSIFKYFFIVMLILSFSRSAYVLLLVYFLISTLFFTKLRNFFRLEKVYIFFTIFILITPFIYLILDRFLDIFNLNYNIIRISIFNHALVEAFDNIKSIILGNGFSNFEFVYNNKIYLNTHNIFLDILHSNGILGLLIFTYIILYLFAKTFPSNQSNTSLDRQTILSKIFILHFIVWTSCLVENTILGVEVGWIIGFLFSIPLFLKYEKDKSDHNH